MTEAKHTPGPWGVIQSHPDERITEIKPSIEKRFHWQATIYAQDDLGINEHRANARLIAAAPDMYDYIKERADIGDPDAIELLAKARGQS